VKETCPDDATITVRTEDDDKMRIIAGPDGTTSYSLKNMNTLAFTSSNPNACPLTYRLMYTDGDHLGNDKDFELNTRPTFASIYELDQTTFQISVDNSKLYEYNSRTDSVVANDLSVKDVFIMASNGNENANAKKDVVVVGCANNDPKVVTVIEDDVVIKSLSQTAGTVTSTLDAKAMFTDGGHCLNEYRISKDQDGAPLDDDSGITLNGDQKVEVD
jgi:hypothetical protein